MRKNKGHAQILSVVCYVSEPFRVVERQNIFMWQWQSAKGANGSGSSRATEVNGLFGKIGSCSFIIRSKTKRIKLIEEVWRRFKL